MNCLYKQKKIAYQKAGTGKPLVLLHGFCEDSTMWSEFCQELTKKYKVLCIDLPGFGHSERLPNLSISEMARAVCAVLDTEEIEACCLIGHSMGGYVGLAFAELFAERLTGLGLFHSHPYADIEERKTNRQKTKQFIQKHGLGVFAKQFVRSLFSATFVKQNIKYIAQLVQQTAQYDIEAVQDALQAMHDRPDRSEVLANLAVPVLFIVGELDEFIAYEQSLAQTALASTAMIHILKNIGHMGMVEAKTQTLNSINQFMNWLKII